jgi:hypothetical protein
MREFKVLERPLRPSGRAVLQGLKTSFLRAGTGSQETGFHPFLDGPPAQAVEKLQGEPG